MELLLFWKAHWMDSWDAEKVASLSAAMRAKYERRYQRGDVVEVREDGYWEKRGFDKSAFAVVRVPGAKPDPDLMSAVYLNELSERPTLIKRRRWSIDEAKVEKEDLEKLKGSDKKVTVTEAKATAMLKKYT